MDALDVLRRQAELAYQEFVLALDGLTEAQAWGILPASGEEYLHTDGSVQGIVLHVATGKRMYASAGFKNLELRWRDLADQVEVFEPSWERALTYLHESHEYWMDSWRDLTDPEQPSPNFRNEIWPAWKVIHTINQHDTYHAGQIAVIRYAATESKSPPPSTAEDIRKYCIDLPSW